MLDLAVLAIFPGLMAYAAISDLLTMKIPNWVSVALMGGFFLMAFIFGLPLSMIGWHVLSAVTVLVICFTLFNFGWMGGGDAKLAAATALWFGFGHLPGYGVVTGILGGLLTIAIVQIRNLTFPKLLSEHPWVLSLQGTTIGIPYGIALAAAGLMIYPQTVVWVAAISL